MVIKNIDVKITFTTSATNSDARSVCGS